MGTHKKRKGICQIRCSVELTDFIHVCVEGGEANPGKSILR